MRPFARRRARSKRPVVVRPAPVVADRGGPAAGLVPGDAVLVVEWGAVRCLRRFRSTWLGPAASGASFDGPIWTGYGFASVT